MFKKLSRMEPIEIGGTLIGWLLLLLALLNTTAKIFNELAIKTGLDNEVFNNELALIYTGLGIGLFLLVSIHQRLNR